MAGELAQVFTQTPRGSLGGDFNPYAKIAHLLVVEGDADEGWITDANDLFCELVNWRRGHLGDPRDPLCLTQTLIGKPLDVLIPPEYRRAHRHFRLAFSANPTPRTMGEGRNTPLWIKDKDAVVSGIDSITGHAATVLIGLSSMDDHHTLAMVQPMIVGKQFALPHEETASKESEVGT